MGIPLVVLCRYLDPVCVCMCVCVHMCLCVYACEAIYHSRCFVCVCALYVKRFYTYYGF